MVKSYRRDAEDKVNSLNRCFFDAEHAWVRLALERLADLRREFPADAQVEYAEGLIRKDFLGQGVTAEEFFLKALKVDPSHLFAAFNSAKYARSEKEFRQQAGIARALAPSDQDLQLFAQIDEALEHSPYEDMLSEAFTQYQADHANGDCAAFAEICLQAGQFSLENELTLRRARAGALRELDKAAEAARKPRGEGFPPEERLALHAAIAELDKALELDPEDHMLWNFKSAWLYLLGRNDEAIAAADMAISLCPEGYLKPLTNKALALASKGLKEEARALAMRAREAADKLGPEGRSDRELAQELLDDMALSLASDDEVLAWLAERITTGASLIARQEMAQWKDSNDGAELLAGLQKRCAAVGTAWSEHYIRIINEMLVFFCPASAWMAILKLSDTNPAAYKECLYATIYIAAHDTSIVASDACRCLVYLLLGALEPARIRKSYREAILGPAVVGDGGFAALADRMRAELMRFQPRLVPLIADQPPLTEDEKEFARRVTLVRFKRGISIRNTPPDGTEAINGRLKGDRESLEKKYNSSVGTPVMFVVMIAILGARWFGFWPVSWFIVIPIAYVAGAVAAALVSTLFRTPQ